jgi:hypothetical protein
MILRAFRNGGSWLTLLAGLVTCSALAGCAGALQETPGPALGVPRALEADVAEGYRAYATTLLRWGRWSADPLYAVRWCPSGVSPTTFVPYRSEGHWAASPGEASESVSSNGTGWGAPPGAPFWLSDDAETWGNITMHHGWWVHVEEGAPEGAWCWIPGAAETAGRVVWRSGDGFVGWAPEGPSAGDDDEADVDDSSWSYAFLGTLLDDTLDLLTDDAAAMASGATRHGRFDPTHPGAPRRSGPSGEQVASARKALSGYVLAHARVASDGVVSGGVASGGVASNGAQRAVATPSVGAPSGSNASGPVAASGSTSSSSSTSSGTSLHLATKEEALPSAMALYDQMMRDPVLGAGVGMGAGWGPGGGLSPFLPFASVAARAQVARAGASSSPPPSHSYGASSTTSHGSSSHSSSSSTGWSSSGKSHGK